MIPRPWKNVSQHDNRREEPRQDRMGESHRTVTLQVFLQNAIHTPGLWINLPQWRKLGKENNIQGAPDKPLPMGLSEHLLPGQEERLPEKTRHGKDDGKYRNSPEHKT